MRDYARIYGLKTVVFRQSCIYGTRQFGIEDQGWVAWFCVAATLGQPFTIFGDGKQIRDTLWVDDLIDAYEGRGADRRGRGRGLQHRRRPGNTLSLRELVAMLGRELGRPLEPAFADWRPGDQRVFVADVARRGGARLDAEGVRRRGRGSPDRLGDCRARHARAGAGVSDGR